VLACVIVGVVAHKYVFFTLCVFTATHRPPLSPRLSHTCTRASPSLLLFVRFFCSAPMLTSPHVFIHRRPQVPARIFSIKAVLSALTRGVFDALALPPRLASALGRKRGVARVPGIVYKSSGTSAAYQFMWRHRVARARTTAALMTRLRVLDAAIRWEDMVPPSVEDQAKEPMSQIIMHRETPDRWFYLVSVSFTHTILLLAHSYPSQHCTGARSYA